MNMLKTCGFMVVRLPEFAEGPQVSKTPSLGERIYRGVDRLPWEDVACDSISPAGEFADYYRDMTHSKMGALGINIQVNLSIAKDILRAAPDINEIISVYSEELSQVGGEFEFDSATEFLGYELFALREWSPHRAGIFFHPELFQEIIPYLNINGLFDESKYCHRLSFMYSELSDLNLVEPLKTNPDYIILSVHKVV